jgi:hypothetical protein
MKALYKATLFLAVGALCMGIGASLRAATIFDNSVNDLVTRFNPANPLNPSLTYEVGDEILLASPADRYLTSFSFEYWGATANPDHVTFAGAVQARVRFYVNDGPLVPAVPNGYASPGSVPFFDSGWFGSFPATDQDPFRATLNFDASSDFPGGVPLFIPTSDMTWSVQFEGMGSGDTVGVDLYSLPVVGSDYPDYWQNDGSGWMLMTNTVPMDFGARFYAESTIPEPSTVTLSILGGLGILTLARRLRRKE